MPGTSDVDEYVRDAAVLVGFPPPNQACPRLRAEIVLLLRGGAVQETWPLDAVARHRRAPALEAAEMGLIVATAGVNCVDGEGGGRIASTLRCRFSARLLASRDREYDTYSL